MSQPPVNFNSLALVHDELDATIQRAAGEFEAHLLDPANADALANCRDDLVQIAGTLRLIQFAGAALLADEMTTAAGEVAAAGGAAAEALAGTLSHAFFALPRYLELVSTHQMGDPTLVIPFVNELRVARRQPLIAENHFNREPVPMMPAQPLPEPAMPAAAAELARLRQMYQVGLLGILRQQAETHNLKLVARASQRFAELLPAGSGAGIWWLAAGVAERMAQGQLALNLNRRRALGTIERLMARYIKVGETFFDTSTSILRDELGYLLAIGGERPGIGATVARAFGIAPLKPDERELARQREALRGPGTEAIDSVVKLIKEELRHAKDILELSAEAQQVSSEDLAPLQETLHRVAEALRVLNLQAACEILQNQLGRVASWRERPDAIPSEQYLAMADALLYIESSLATLYRGNVDQAEAGQVTEAMRRRLVAQTQLEEASAIVIEESQAAIALAKRAIISYQESGCDPIHIANVGVALDSVRGAMFFLNEQRPAELLRGCVLFVDEGVTNRNYSAPQRQQLLETLADALISIEYYLNELAAGRRPDAKILDVADDSLAALGLVA